MYRYMFERGEGVKPQNHVAGVYPKNNSMLVTFKKTSAYWDKTLRNFVGV